MPASQTVLAKTGLSPPLTQLMLFHSKTWHDFTEKNDISTKYGICACKMPASQTILAKTDLSMVCQCWTFKPSHKLLSKTCINIKHCKPQTRVGAKLDMFRTCCKHACVQTAKSLYTFEQSRRFSPPLSKLMLFHSKTWHDFTEKNDISTKHRICACKMPASQTVLAKTVLSPLRNQLILFHSKPGMISQRRMTSAQNTEYVPARCPPLRQF